MARHVVHRVTDDPDGSPDAVTIQFSLDGQTYEIDLGPRNEAKFRDALSPFISHGTRLRAGRTRPGGRRARTDATGQTDRDRAQWALEHGVQLPSRGRVAQAVLDALADDDVPPPLRGRRARVRGRNQAQALASQVDRD